MVLTINEYHMQCGRSGFNPWVGKIPWRRTWQLAPVFWPGEFHGLYKPWGHKESDTTEQLSTAQHKWLHVRQIVWMSIFWLWYCATTFAKCYHWGKASEKKITLSVLFLTTACKSTIISHTKKQIQMETISWDVVPRWQRNRTGRPLYPPQIHHKITYM